eukprot:CAMPEP_0119303352 /NCGR_PEP_ID=MMETSP1333-20130426/4800_1 /TAXON_ID=418940 /ORGANISM="Scyphosphaera apsteinii, Strain RCC1455" /LENGTH=63 /DNA_ID=CAMNT_0007306003 /DNA_START=409 /DNA_END=597 /DNA_ORIENTATION=+
MSHISVESRAPCRRLLIGSLLNSLPTGSATLGLEDDVKGGGMDGGGTDGGGTDGGGTDGGGTD